MSANDQRYEPIGEVLPLECPPITREEATRAAKALYRVFGKGELRSANYPADITFGGRVLRCWISRKPTSGSAIGNGWPRLVHDVSHRIFRRRHPGFKPHAGGHATLEREIAQHVVAKGWLNGTLRPKERVKPSRDDVRATRLARCEANIARWNSKLRRAETALKKLSRQHRALTRAITIKEMPK